MLRNRLIPVLLLQNGLLVRSEKFSIHQVIGNPLEEVERFNEWNVDELIYLDITPDNTNYSHRDDHRVKIPSDPLAILDAVSKTCFMPLTFGGGIRKLEDIRARIAGGADKVSLNTEAYNRPGFVTEAAKSFGSQAIVVSIDAGLDEAGEYRVVIEGGKRWMARNPVEWAHELEERGAGEILLQSIERDGAGTGYDLELIHRVASRLSIPVIACSGVGMWEHYAKGIEAGASAVAAANIWHFQELTDRRGKRALAKAGVPVRL
ncbi:imidazole glycerol phosphate synthase subunit HisF [bacterium]|nr:MAG: imidazole glycerol phosphate synthase subunit HisF [bacterium]